MSLRTGDVTSVAALGQMGLFTTLLINGSSLLDAGVVALELDPSVGREVEDMLHRLPVSSSKTSVWSAKSYHRTDTKRQKRGAKGALPS